MLGLPSRIILLALRGTSLIGNVVYLMLFSCLVAVQAVNRAT